MSYNDEPTLNDLLEREPLVVQLAEKIKECKPPYVFGLHGAWGSGKTSFLHQLQKNITGECPQSQDNSNNPGKTSKNCEFVAIWFESWRYQHDKDPIVALLHEIRNQLEWKHKTWNAIKKTAEVTIRGGLMGLESLTKKIGISPSSVQKTGEQWEAQHHATPLPTHVIRSLLDESIQQVLSPARTDAAKGKTRKLLILIDDLDRCEPEAAYRLLEGIKIYLNIPSCVFVIGMDRDVIELAVAKHVPIDEKDAEALKCALVKEYIEKICQSFWRLPLITDPENKLSRWLTDLTKGKRKTKRINEIEAIIKGCRSADTAKTDIKK